MKNVVQLKEMFLPSGKGTKKLYSTNKIHNNISSETIRLFIRFLHQHLLLVLIMAGLQQLSYSLICEITDQVYIPELHTKYINNKIESRTQDETGQCTPFESLVSLYEGRVSLI